MQDRCCYLNQIILSSHEFRDRLPSILLAVGAALTWAVLLPAQNSQFVRVNPLYFTMPVGGAGPQPQSLKLTSIGNTIFCAHVTVETKTGGNWLQVSTRYACTSGLLGDTSNVAFVTVIIANAGSLPAGTYKAQLLFTAGTATMAVPVTLAVASLGEAFFGDLPDQLLFVGGHTDPLPPRTVQITNAGSGALNWTVAVSTSLGTAGNWLIVSALSGTAPSTVTVRVSTEGLKRGIYTGQLLFQSPASNVTVPVSLWVANDFVPQRNAGQPEGITQFGHGSIMMYDIKLRYSALPLNGSYLLPVSTEEHCYVAGISFTAGKGTLFIRVEDPYTGSGPDRYTCGYHITRLNPPIKDDVSNKRTAETQISPGETTTASVSIVDGKVELSVADSKNAISFGKEDPYKRRFPCCRD